MITSNISDMEDADHIRVKTSDTGIGMNEKVVSRVCWTVLYYKGCRRRDRPRYIGELRRYWKTRRTYRHR